MTITKDAALQRAYNHLSSEMKDRLEIVDHISGCLYGSDNIDVKNSWIAYVHPEESRVDGPAQYVVINKQTGSVTEVATG